MRYTWRKKPGTGLHMFMQDGKRVKARPNGPPIEASLEELGSHRDQYDCLGARDEKGNLVMAPTEDEIEEAISGEADAVSLEIRHKGGGYYDVINPDFPDKPLNDVALRKDEAMALAGIEGNDEDEEDSTEDEEDSTEGAEGSKSGDDESDSSDNPPEAEEGDSNSSDDDE